MPDKQTWCNARRIPSTYRNMDWVNALYELSIQLKDQSAPAKQKVECRKQIYKILADQRIKCQQTLQQKSIQHVLPMFTRVEQIFAHLSMADPQQPSPQKESKKKTKSVDPLAKTQRRLQQEAQQFQEKWESKLSEIAEEFPPGENINLPSEPYQPEDITAFIRQAKPLVKRGKIWGFLITFGTVGGAFIGLELEILKHTDRDILLGCFLGLMITHFLWRLLSLKSQ